MAESLLKSIDLNEQKPSPHNYICEIRRMMYGFGDCAEPLIESARLINDVVHREMKSLVYAACEIADERDSNIIDDCDFLFLLRRDKIKLQRLVKYLELKAFKGSITKSLETDTPESGLNTEGNDTKKKNYQKFIKLIDNIGELSDTQNRIDYVKHNRDVRAELASRKMDTLHYMEYTKARAATFTNKCNGAKFENWIGIDDVKISKNALTILGFLAYETVAQIMDFAFLVRQDQNKIHGDSLDRLRLSYCNPTTYKPYQHGKGSVMKPITPTEIHETLRRYLSPQLDTTGPFQRGSINNRHRKFIAI
ncbi:hypothetical protein PV327_001248 [Microctonus hyperodae]|uniref:Transcription initiation protein SPT3 homolog n=1 Tax=Microctonus hyperodae TaxID=165561 RepID=A0AA39G905_MICHY|nr:hypothetical protein PV327_001248 [Microctonus hyperodae]